LDITGHAGSCKRGLGSLLIALNDFCSPDLEIRETPVHVLLAEES
jgi:hypothetical protein